jgi:tRNA(Ile)-lysidine synthase
MNLLEGVHAFFRQVPLDRGDRLVVAFSGGGDSTALLWALARWAPLWRIHLVAAHLDHAMDAGSRQRAARAADLARRLEVPLVHARRVVPLRRRRGESLEAAARRVRYQFLEEVRRAVGARYVATAHHRDDQAETVLLRLRFGTGLRGLTAIQPSAGTLVRPLLELPRSSLRLAVATAGLTPCEDPGNDDPRQPRSRMRHQGMPALARSEAAAEAELAAGLARLAARAQRAMPALDRRLAAAIDVRAGAAAGPGPCGSAETATADCRLLAALPAPLLSHALAVLHRRAGAAWPASLAAASELRRQLRPRRDRRVACDCGAGWRWQAAGEQLCLQRTPPGQSVGHESAAHGAHEPVPPFTYTLEVPGELTIPELAVTIRVSRNPAEAWMLRGAPLRAGLALPLPGSGAVTVRNRRLGDRLRPLGSPGSRKLKEILIDRGVPRWQRDRLPLVCWAGEIAWIPGITIDHRFRLTGQAEVCLAEVILPGQR